MCLENWSFKWRAFSWRTLGRDQGVSHIFRVTVPPCPTFQYSVLYTAWALGNWLCARDLLLTYLIKFVSSSVKHIAAHSVPVQCVCPVEMHFAS